MGDPLDDAASADGVSHEHMHQLMQYPNGVLHQLVHRMSDA